MWRPTLFWDEGKLRLEMAYEYATGSCMEVSIGEKKAAAHL
jgi:hypothetical protein